jgi:hypothetical protein
MRKFLLTSAAVFTPPDTPVTPPGNGADVAPQFVDLDTIGEERRATRGKAVPMVDEITGEPIVEPPPSAAPPPPQSDRAQKVAHKLNLDEIRKLRGQPVASVNVILRIPVVDRPRTDLFIRAHPLFGGLNDTMPIWTRVGVGSGGNKPLLVKPHMVELIRAHGGKVNYCGLWWCQYSGGGGQFIGVANTESDNDWIATRRDLYERCRDEWLKMLNAGNCWQGSPPPAAIPDPKWPDFSWDDVLNLGFEEAVDEKHPAFAELVYGGNPPTVEK